MHSNKNLKKKLEQIIFSTEQIEFLLDDLSDYLLNIKGFSTQVLNTLETHLKQSK